MSTQVPKIDLSNSKSVSKSDFEDAYNSHQVLHIRGYSASNTRFGSSDVQSLFTSLGDEDKKSWCIENKSNGDVAQPCDFLHVNNKEHRGYCSFLVQHSKDVMDDLLSKQLPMVHLPVRSDESSNEKSSCKTNKADESLMLMNYGPCIWFFFGKNYNTKQKPSDEDSLLGRPEHTDSVRHDGTWHYQLSGTKIWRLRPTDELLSRIQQSHGANEECNISKKRKLADANDDTSITNGTLNNKFIEMECNQGDILFINTRLWWHSTVIPPQDSPSISYARDVYFADKANPEGEVANNSGQQQSSMTNIDGTYAAQDIEASTVIFTEHSMPDCELHRSKTNPNCQVVELEDEESGETYMAVVSLRDIKAGEFFCVMESDSEEDGEAEDDGNWDEEVENDGD